MLGRGVLTAALLSTEKSLPFRSQCQIERISPKFAGIQLPPARCRHSWLVMAVPPSECRSAWISSRSGSAVSCTDRKAHRDDGPRRECLRQPSPSWFRVWAAWACRKLDTAETAKCAWHPVRLGASRPAATHLPFGARLQGNGRRNARKRCSVLVRTATG